MKFAAFVTHGLAQMVLVFAGAKLAKVLSRLGHYIGEQLHLDAAEWLACVEASVYAVREKEEARTGIWSVGPPSLAPTPHSLCQSEEKAPRLAEEKKPPKGAVQESMNSKGVCLCASVRGTACVGQRGVNGPGKGMDADRGGPSRNEILTLTAERDVEKCDRVGRLGGLGRHAERGGAEGFSKEWEGGWTMLV